ncbi:ABC transporter ATP-binding protein [Occultella kanbiaonis]|uniref:ABC transporter ATP-binding protein n=1 Tax=Occultella kanbiaonis TaxID=2675754 RepID=UPI0013D89BA6|nr:ATP-binding cassette domain-containing protein [Occultella kanbiaonis]
MHAIEITDLHKSYGPVEALRGVSFTAAEGRVVGLLGPNGAGKSTSVHILLGLARATSGTAAIGGSAYSDLDHPARTVGALLDQGGLHRGRSGRDHLRVLAAAAHLPEAAVAVALEKVGMTRAADRRVGTYSLGMRQRIGLAAALLGEPRILVLDEPANGLDPAGMAWLRGMLRSFADGGGTVLLASHVLAEVAQVADDLVVIGEGRVLADGPLADVMAGDTLEHAYLDLTAASEGMF